MASIIGAKIWLKRNKKQQQQQQQNQEQHTPSQHSGTSFHCSPADATISAPSSASPSSVLHSFLPSHSLLKKSSLANSTLLSPASASVPPLINSTKPAGASILTPLRVVSITTVPDPLAVANNTAAKLERKPHPSTLSTTFPNSSLPSLPSSSPRHRTAMPGFLHGWNSSLHSLPFKQKSHQRKQQQQQEQNSEEFDYQPPNPRFRHSRNFSSSNGSKSSHNNSNSSNKNTGSFSMIRTGSRPHAPPLPPTTFKIPHNSNNINGDSNNNNNASNNGTSSRQRSLSLAKPKPPVTATASAAPSSGIGGHKMFKNLSARFNETAPVVETVAQEYARVIKSLWQMVEEEELSYEIDAAATAAREQLEQEQRDLILRSKQSSGKISESSEEAVIRICREPCCFTSTDGASGSNTRSAHGPLRTTSSGTLIQKEDRAQHAHVQLVQVQTLQQPEHDYPSWTWDRPNPLPYDSIQTNFDMPHHTIENHEEDINENSSRDGGGSEEGRKQRKRELEELERELIILGFQRYPSTPSSTSSPMPQEPEQPAVLSLPIQSIQSPQSLPSPQRGHRKRQNSLAYEERRLEQDSLLHSQHSKPHKSSHSASTTASIITIPQKHQPILLNFRDGILHEENSNDDSNGDDDDEDIVSVAQRVSLRPWTQEWSQLQKQGANGQGRQQRPSWDVERARGRGASWSVTARTQPNAHAHARMGSLPVGTPSVAAMISAR